MISDIFWPGLNFSRVFWYEEIIGICTSDASQMYTTTESTVLHALQATKLKPLQFTALFSVPSFGSRDIHPSNSYIHCCSPQPHIVHNEKSLKHATYSQPKDSTPGPMQVVSGKETVLLFPSHANEFNLCPSFTCQTCHHRRLLVSGRLPPASSPTLSG